MYLLRTIIVSACLLLGTAPPLMADITRGCEATFRVEIVGGSSSEFQNLGSIEGRGGCQNKAHANDCRARARAEIDRCIAAMWRDRHKNAIAPECKTLVSNSSRSGAELSWNGISAIAEPNRLSARMAYSACCRIRPKATRIQVAVFGAIFGDRKCGATNTGHNLFQSDFDLPTYDMNCSAWRSQGLCGR